MKKPFYSGLSILEMHKTIMYEFQHDYVKPKYGEKTNQVTWVQLALQST